MLLSPFHFVRGWFPTHLKSEVRELYAATTIQNIALAMVAIFEPVYLYQSGYSLAFICLFYAGVYALYCLLLPLGVKFALRWGYEKGITIGTVLWVVLYLCLAASVVNPGWLYVAVAAYALQKMFYWPGFHANFAQYSSGDQQGREISGITALNSVAYVIGPLAGAALLATGGFATLFIVVAALLLVSNIALLITPEHFEPETIRYGTLWRNLWQPENRTLRLRSFAYGEELIVMVVWPVVMAIAVAQNNTLLGVVAAGATLATALFTLYVGSLSDRRSPLLIMRYGALMLSLSYAVRPFFTTVGGVLGIDTLGRFSKNTVGVPFTHLLYQEARAEGRVMKRVMTFEFGLALIKCLVALAAAVLAAAGLPWWIIFALAGGLSLLYLA